jgi:hypothetical protein
MVALSSNTARMLAIVAVLGDEMGMVQGSTEAYANAAAVVVVVVVDDDDDDDDDADDDDDDDGAVSSALSSADVWLS